MGWRGVPLKLTDDSSISDYHPDNDTLSYLDATQTIPNMWLPADSIAGPPF